MPLPPKKMIEYESIYNFIENVRATAQKISTHFYAHREIRGKYPDFTKSISLSYPPDFCTCTAPSSP